MEGHKATSMVKTGKPYKEGEKRYLPLDTFTAPSVYHTFNDVHFMKYLYDVIFCFTLLDMRRLPRHNDTMRPSADGKHGCGLHRYQHGLSHRSLLQKGKQSWIYFYRCMIVSSGYLNCCHRPFLQNMWTLFFLLRVNFIKYLNWSRPRIIWFAFLVPILCICLSITAIKLI